MPATRRVLLGLALLLTIGGLLLQAHISSMAYTGHTRLEAELFRQPARDDEVISTPNASTTAPPLITKVLIHARYRTGSTFTSDFLSHHHTAFFLYEPFYLLPPDIIKNHTVAILSQLLDCDFSSYLTLASALNKDHEFAKWRRKTFCWNDIESCENFDRREIEERCLSQSVRVIKLIRVPSLEELAPLMEDGVKVIRLVRDPRGVISSRDRIRHLQRGFEKDSSRYCEDIFTDLNYSTAVGSASDERQHLSHIFVRYEDLAADPLTYVGKLYSFLGVEPDQETVSWVLQYLPTGDVDQTAAGEGRLARSRTYNTVRSDPGKTSLDWRNKLTFTESTVIQQTCREIMAALGYIPVYQHTQLKHGRLTIRSNIL